MEHTWCVVQIMPGRVWWKSLRNISVGARIREACGHNGQRRSRQVSYPTAEAGGLTLASTPRVVPWSFIRRVFRAC